MGAENEWIKLRALLIAGVVFVVSMCMSWTELNYLVRGKTAQATGLGTHLEKSPRGKYGEEYVTRIEEYGFEDGGTFRREADQVPLEWREPTGGKVAVKYIPGKKRESRLVGMHPWNWLWMVVFFGSLAVVGWKVTQLWREAYE